MGESLALAIGIFFIIEGIGPMLFPKKWGQYIKALLEQGPNGLRQMGTFMVVLGVIIIWFSR